jgi:exodeoxyribonuclease III
MLSLLTVNMGAASRERAENLLRWLAKRSEDAFLLTETSAGPGTDYLLGQFRTAGYAVVHTPGTDGDRGSALVSRARLHPEPFEHFANASLPGRLAGAVLDTKPQVAVLSVYVPSRDRTLDKTEKKQKFIASLLSELDAMPGELRGRLVIGGDYNVIARDHRPLHPGFLPFEFGLLEALERHGFVDAHHHCAPGVQAHSWIGRTGDGYRYDYFHVGHDLSGRSTACTYLHETREQRLTDHAAVSLDLDIEAVRRLDTAELLGGDSATLF